MNNSSDITDKLPLVFVTGASGFVALHCVKRLLEGPYRVRGTVRTKNDKKTIAPLLRLPHAISKLEIVEADLMGSPEHWVLVMSGCTFVLHVASPVIIRATEEIVATAVNGTLNVLAAANACPEVKHVVVTSSCAAINDGHENPPPIFDESFWTDVESKNTEWYGRSKTLAERAAWQYWHSLPEPTRFSLTVLCPTVVFGPVLSDRSHASASALARMMKRSTSLAQPKVSIGVVDVRDVAEAHVRVLERPETDGERILITATPSAWFADIARWLKKEFSPYGYRISTLKCPDWILKVYAASGVDPESKTILGRLGEPTIRFDNSKSIRLLDMQYRRVDKAVADMMHSMIEMGIVKATNKYQKRNRKVAKVENVFQTTTV
ncbi:hypothetical protein PENTCL1PPCAC_3158 [Pristionchus entomophagus]|uniref:NAD-dependent epimerase/dehydratase domain-containing protein n=1 Tax=Pristionchus entomophagus TaxID=358040 RepID=A0AAV5SJZ0_9BILA|nr:hypothetical protein PENTCL1PPCAC_3158 [Pristionchus entomophagus]